MGNHVKLIPVDSHVIPKEVLNTKMTNMELRKTFKYAELVAHVFGILGSLLIIVIMVRPTFRKMPKSRVCLVLAVVNLIFLIYTFSTRLYEMVERVSPLVINATLCKLNLPIRAFLIHMDASLIIILSLERLLAVIKPFHVNIIVTFSRIKIIIAILTVLFLIFDGEVYFRTDLYYKRIPKLNTTIPICKFIEDRPVYGIPFKVMLIKDKASVLLRSFIPIAILVPTNLIIIIKLFRQKQARANMRNPSSQNPDKTSKITRMIVSASIAFIITVTPISVANLIIPRRFWDSDPLFVILGFVYRLNPVLNFYIYFLSGSLFRKELKLWLSSLKMCSNCPPSTSP